MTLGYQKTRPCHRMSYASLDCNGLPTGLQQPNAGETRVAGVFTLASARNKSYSSYIILNQV